MKKLIIYINILIIFMSCGENNEIETPILSSENKIESFIIDGIETNLSETNKTINIITTASQAEFLFTPKIIVSDKATISPGSETNHDFSNEINFTVTAENGVKQVYKSNLIKQTGLKSIKLKLESDYIFQTFYYNGIINEVDKKIIIDFPKSNIQTYQYNTYLIMDVTGDNISSFPESETEIDTETLNTIEINKPEGNETYSIEFRNIENNLTCFSIPVSKHFSCAFSAKNSYEEYKTGLNDHDLIFYTLEDQDINSITPDKLNISIGATITPNSETPQNFTNDIVYEVVSETGNIKKYKVRVIKKKILLTNDWSPTLSNGKRVSSSSFFLGYYAVSKVKEASLINSENSNEMACEIIANDYVDSSTETHLVIKYGTQPSLDEKFSLKVTLEDGSIVYTKYRISIVN